MEIDLAKKIFDYLFIGSDGYRISAQSRCRMGAAKQNKSLVYGEIDFMGFADLLRAAPLTSQHQIFYDLGSGTGKAVLAAALLGKFTQVSGVELIEELYNEANRILDKFSRQIKPLFPEDIDSRIGFIKDDFFNHNFSQADVVLVQSTCLGEEGISQLQQQKLNQLKTGSLVITATEHLEPPFEIISSGPGKMGWGTVTVYYHLKRG